jgi:hypothetical protein
MCAGPLTFLSMQLPPPQGPGTRMAFGMAKYELRIRRHESSISSIVIFLTSSAALMLSSVIYFACGISMSKPWLIESEVEWQAPQSLTYVRPESRLERKN